MANTKLIENYFIRKVIKEDVGNMEDIAQFQYNLEKLGYEVQQFDSKTLTIIPKDSKNPFTLVTEMGKEPLMRIAATDISLKNWDEFTTLAQRCKTACELSNDFIASYYNK